MIVNINNENYGSAVATHDNWVVVGNPSSFRYNPDSASYLRTGSVDIFRYNSNTDQHDLLVTINKPINGGDFVVLAEDPTANFIYTDIVKTTWIPRFSFTGGWHLHWFQWNIENLPIQIDATAFNTPFEDDYGHAIDVYNDILVIGSRWHNQKIDIAGKLFYATGSSVDIYNLSILNATPLDGNIYTGSSFLAKVILPATGEPLSGSFGYSVSINNEWLAVGSPLWHDTSGSVHMYRRASVDDPNDFNWNYFSTISGSVIDSGSYFGHSIDINKATGSYSASLVVGCGNKTSPGNKVYYFQFDGTDWIETHTFEADRSLYNLPFYDIDPIISGSSNSIDGFGNCVCLYKNDVAIGAPTDRWIYEYSGSRAYTQGAAYLYNQCDNLTWRFVKKFYGNDKTIKNNKMGFSMDLWENKFVLGCPKSNIESMNSCYLEGSIFQQNYCYADLENYIHGQWVLFEKNTSSADIDWDVTNVYQRKKRYLSPYRALGYDVAIGNKSIVIGAPMTISDTNRVFDITHTSSFNGNINTELEDLAGKSYIYNLSNFRDEFHVGNVFYRNGKIVLNTSGSVFNGLWFNPITEDNYEYEVHFDSKQTLFEKQIVCTVQPNEFNVSTNPSALVYDKISYDLNSNGKFDWQDLDMILRYMQRISTRYSLSGVSTDWSSSLLLSKDEVSFYNYNFNSNDYSLKSGDDYMTDSFYKILDTIGEEEFDFNQDSKVDINDLNILWKYYSNRLTQTNYKSYITPNSKRKLFSDIIDYLDGKTGKNNIPTITSDFLTANELSETDKTGSYLKPMVTTIGLYQNLDLIAVAKMGTPIKLDNSFPINFMIKMDF